MYVYPTDTRECPAPSVLYFNIKDYAGVISHRYHRHVIGIILQGRKSILSGDRQVSIGMGDLYFLKKGSYYVDNLPQENGSFQQVVLFFSSQELCEIIQSSEAQKENACPFFGPAKHEGSCYVERSWDNLIYLFREIVANVRHRTTNFDDTFDRGRSIEIVRHILLNEDSIVRQALLATNQLHQNKKPCDLTERLLQGETLPTIAEERGVSERTLKRFFFNQYGMTPNQWIARHTMEEALALILESDKGITEIASTCGFASPSHFIASFRKRYGISPSQYRHKIRG